MPPAFSQSAWFFAVVTSPAKAGPVKASAKANANVEMSVFMDKLLTMLGGVRRTSFQHLSFHANLFALATRIWIANPLYLDRLSLVWRSIAASEAAGEFA